MKEIGGEFWEKQTTVYEGDNEHSLNTAALLSGRTALDFIVRDIKSSRQLQAVALPSYCCESMIDPFIRNGVEVEFYNVGTGYIKVESIPTSDAILLLDFFGYRMPENEIIARNSRNSHIIVIYDSVHRIIGNPSVEKFADYSFYSYRKWCYANYAKVVKHTGSFLISSPSKSNEIYCSSRDKAADLKALYMAGERFGKKEFLNLYSSAEAELDHNYQNFSGRPVKIGVETKDIVSRRRRNAERLINGLADVSGIHLWINSLHPGDSPLFLPILVDSDLRDNLKRHLIKHDIYTPVHWPLSDLHKSFGICDEIYNEELSLICDQRYSLEDMDRQIDVLREFFTL